VFGKGGGTKNLSKNVKRTAQNHCIVKGKRIHKKAINFGKRIKWGET